MTTLRRMKSAEEEARECRLSPSPRARSSSPIKNRRPLSPCLDSFSSDVTSIASSPLTHEQLVQLSRSPIARRLHITKPEYAIPIPFTLKLPPRLSGSGSQTPQKESSPSASPKHSPKRLFFSGQDYEAASSGSESESEIARDYEKLAAVAKPPSVTASRKKVAKFVEKSNTVPADQLSMIEESSTRTNSVKSKELPQIPESKLMPVGLSKPPHNVILGARGPSLTRKLLRKPPPDLVFDKRTPTETSAMPVKASVPYGKASLDPTSDLNPKEALKLDADRLKPTTGSLGIVHLTNAIHRQDNKQPQRQQPHPEQQQRQNQHPEQLQQQQQQQHRSIRTSTGIEPNHLPQTQAYRHNLYLGDKLKNEKNKRAFSDESQVSSVSSFNSFGDFAAFKFGTVPHSLNETSPQELSSARDNSLRQTSGSSTVSSVKSWNSLQRSLDLSLKNTLSNMSRSLPENSDGTSKSLPELPWDDVADRTIEVAPLCISKSVNEKAQTLSDGKEWELIELGKEESLEDSIEDEDSELQQSSGSVEYNNGDGKRFSFPNNLSNITNSKEAKQRTPKINSSASYTLISPTGQIKIPDLENASQHYLMNESRKDSVEPPLEPIGYPSKAAREYFNSMYDNLSTDSDTDGSFNSQFTKLNCRSQQKLPEKKALITKPAPPSVTSVSPVIHTRHRSVHSIDLASFEKEEITRGKQRPKSVADVELSRPSSTDKCEEISRNKDVNEEADLRVEDPLEDTSLRIVVAEPPAKVKYAVDFKSTFAPPIKSQRSATGGFDGYYLPERMTSRSAKENRRSYPLTDSELASSYHSSNTAGETLSTAPTETGSITIDLTKEGYDLCMIKRQDSTLSYKSVIEKTKDGQNVEVVLVDEDEDASTERDDLLSIYSRYMGHWEAREPYRSFSTRSYASESSEASSWAGSESNFQIKRIPAIQNTRPYPTSAMFSKKEVSTFTGASHARGINKLDKTIPNLVSPSKNSSLPSRREVNYFDYSSNAKYDFNSFINQRDTASLRR